LAAKTGGAIELSVYFGVTVVCSKYKNPITAITRAITPRNPSKKQTPILMYGTGGMRVFY
jgi:hypothetical protein